MKVPAAVWAAGLLCLQGAHATALVAKRLADMATKGLSPNGSPRTLSKRVDGNSPSVVEIPEEYVKIPLDHFAKDKNYDYDGYFYNRFYVYEDGYKPGAPVFIWDVGEQSAEDVAQDRLDKTNPFRQIVDRYNGLAIVWEHRYYGNSTPEPILVTTPPEAYRWLNTEQALADVDFFAKQFKRENIAHDLTPKKTPWVMVGASYPGMRAALMRDRYPDTIFAAFAGSAPVQAKTDMSVYFDPIYDGLQRFGFGNCTRDAQAAIRYADKLMDKGYTPEVAKMKQVLLGKGAGKNSHGAFAEMFQLPFMNWQNDGIEGGKGGLRDFCDHISTDPVTNRTSGAAGWAKTKGAQWSFERWASWPVWIELVNFQYFTECSGSQTIEGNCDLDQPFPWGDYLPWVWQFCTEWGFFQMGNVGPKQLGSKYSNLEQWKHVCHRQWPNATWEEHGFPELPRTKETNEKFGGWNIRPSNTFWAGGEFDPFRTLSPLADQWWAPRVREFQKPPRCGVKQSRLEIFGYVKPNASHSHEFKAKTPEVGAATRKYFTDALDQWLTCFKPSK